MNVTAEDSLPGQLRSMQVGEIKVLAERLAQDHSTSKDISNAMTMLRNRATTAITRASTQGRKFHRDSKITRVGESHDPVVEVFITRVE